jgi:hypothetical protein
LLADWNGNYAHGYFSGEQGPMEQIMAGNSREARSDALDMARCGRRGDLTGLRARRNRSARHPGYAESEGDERRPEGPLHEALAYKEARNTLAVAALDGMSRATSQC